MVVHDTSVPASTVDGLAAELRGRGWVVLPERLPSALVAELAAAFVPLLDAHIAARGPNRGVNRYQMYLPFDGPFADPAFYADPLVLAVVAAVLGPDAECTYYGSDTPLPGAEHQAVHQDGAPLFPETEIQLPLYSIALNVPLVDVDGENGPLEWFPGPGRPDPGDEPLRFTAPAGTCLLRDTRLWHRGSPHGGTGPRPMLALLYNRPWYRFVLDRPILTRSRYEALPDVGRRLFRGADITPRGPATADRPRLGAGPGNQTARSGV